VRALARRSPSTPPVLVRCDLRVDRVRRVVTRAGRPVLLTRKELGVLEVLLEAKGAVVCAERLLEAVWDENADPFTTTVRAQDSVTPGLGEHFLGESLLKTGLTGEGTTTLTVPLTAPASALTVSATSPDGDTSEFSPCLALGANAPTLHSHSGRSCCRRPAVGLCCTNRAWCSQPLAE
jgi:hypothetical protein